MAKKNLTVATAEAAAAPTFSPEQVNLIEVRLDGPTKNIYLAANLATILSEGRQDDDLELSNVLRHMSKLLMKAAEALAPDEIITYAERTEEVAS